MNYIAIDVDTANPDYACVCQVGVVVVRGGEISTKRSLLFNPDAAFDPANVALHGVTRERVAGAPHFADLMPGLAAKMQPIPILHHGPLVRVAMDRAALRHGCRPFDLKWLDNARIARESWPDLASSGTGLRHLCEHFDIECEGRDALANAVATARLATLACDHTGIPISGWLERLGAAARPDRGASEPSEISQDGEPEGPCQGETIVFTGGFSRTDNVEEVKQAARRHGFAVAGTVTSKTTILCLGDIQQREAFAGHDKSLKHRKAEERMRKGADLRIVSEETFFSMIGR